MTDIANKIQYCSNFVDMITDPNEKNKSEIFKLCAIQEYISIWTTQTCPSICTVCNFAINKYKSQQQQLTKRFMIITNEFAKNMPENMVGVICTWLFMRYFGEEIMTPKVAFSLDPLSILFHNIIGCCNAEMGTDTMSFDMCQVLQSSLLDVCDEEIINSGVTQMNQSEKKRSKKQKILINYNQDSSDNCDMQEDIACSSNGDEDINNDNVIDVDVNILIECVREYVESVKSKKKSNLFSCKYIPGCVYDNDGNIDKGIKMRRLNDCRIYVSDKWVKKNLNIGYNMFLSSDNYAKYQPGIFACKLKQKENNIISSFAMYMKDGKEQINERHSEYKRITVNREQSLNGFVAAESMPLNEDVETNDTYISEHYQRTNDLKKRVLYLQSLIHLIPNIFTNTTSPVSIISRVFPICKWCTFCIDSRMRMIINDIYVMCEENTNAVGIGTGWYGVRVASSNDSHYLCNTPETMAAKAKVDHGYGDHVKYSLGFYKSAVSSYILKSVFTEWCEVKYPVLQTIINCQNNEKEILNLQIHQDPNKSIYCSGNIRRMYIESDLLQQHESYRCFIMHAIKLLQVLLKMNVKLSKEKRIIKKMALDHNIAISLISV
jgi:hypothetical protein